MIVYDCQCLRPIHHTTGCESGGGSTCHGPTIKCANKLRRLRCTKTFSDVTIFSCRFFSGVEKYMFQQGYTVNLRFSGSGKPVRDLYSGSPRTFVYSLFNGVVRSLITLFSSECAPASSRHTLSLPGNKSRILNPIPSIRTLGCVLCGLFAGSMGLHAPTLTQFSARLAWAFF